MKVLVVDDDKLICWALEKALKSKGYDVSISLSGEEANERLEKTSFDMVIADFKMPGTDGMGVLRAVRKRYPATIAILMSAFATVPVVLEAEEQGIYYVAKPFEIDSFVKRIGELLEARTRS